MEAPAKNQGLQPAKPVRGSCFSIDTQRGEKVGGARRDRTADLYNAIVALSQLSYGPISCAPANAGTGRRREILGCRPRCVNRS